MAVGAGLDIFPPTHAAETPLLSPASTSGPPFPLSIYGEEHLGLSQARVDTYVGKKRRQVLLAHSWTGPERNVKP